jgi:serine/threonine protein phosphatase PrpC
MKFSIYQRSEKGGRANNEDRMGYTYTRESALFVLTDGMGGHAHGELAAQIALEAMTQYFQQNARPKAHLPEQFLTKSLLHAHHQILEFTHEQGLTDSPRTTIVALLVQDGQAWWTHCGDSRLYWVREGELIARTIDHSYVEQTPLNIKLSKPTDANHLAKIANRNVLFTCLGAPTKPIFETQAGVKLEHGDRFLLCSDGLWSHFNDKDLAHLFCVHAVAQCTSQLIDLSLKKGGATSDNVTAIGVEWEADEPWLPTSANLVTDSLLQNDFATTVEQCLLGSAAQEAQHVNHFDIELSLKEINLAIQKYTLTPKPNPHQL